MSINVMAEPTTTVPAEPAATVPADLAAAVPAEPSASVPMCSNCHSNPVIAKGAGLCHFDDWCAACDGSLHASQFAQAAPSSAIATASMCTNCLCRPIHSNSMFDDWCAECDLAQRTAQEWGERCVRARLPRPPPHPIGHGNLVCPCGFFAIRHRPLARPRPGKENLPLHQLVTVPLSSTAHIILCLICERTFKHHRHAVQHLQSHHTHFHEHHGSC